MIVLLLLSLSDFNIICYYQHNKSQDQNENGGLMECLWSEQCVCDVESPVTDFPPAEVNNCIVHVLYS